MLRKRFSAALLFILAVSCTGVAQVLDKAVLNSAVWISYEIPASIADPKQTPKPSPEPPAPLTSGGTGFLLFQDVGYTRGQVFLVTNRHVLPREGKPQDIRIRVLIRNGEVVLLTVPVVGADGKYLRSVKLHPDPNTDVAAVDIAAAAFSSKLDLLVEEVTNPRYLNTSMLVTSDRIRQSAVGIGSSVYLIGFPASLFDARNVNPILRIGVIATDPSDGFWFSEEMQRTMHFPPHLNGFLVDANVFPGSSGSLVVLAPEKADKVESASSRSAFRRTQILGIVGGSIPIFDASLRAYERIGLGMVYSADAIRDVIRMFAE